MTVKITLHATTVHEPGASRRHSVEFRLRQWSDRTPTLPVTIVEDSGVESAHTGAPNPASLATRQLLLLKDAVARLEAEMRATGMYDDGVVL